MKNNKVERKENFISRFFALKERNTSLKTEIIGGIIVFICMCYILPVNSNILSDMGMSKSGVFTMTAIVGAICSLLMGIFANYPITLSAGMGLNAFLAYTVSGHIFEGNPNAWQMSMIVLALSGIVFFVFSLTPFREKIISAIPKDLKALICGALGMFICFVGLKGSGLISDNGATLVQFGQLIRKIEVGDKVIYDPSALIALIGILIVLVLMFIKTKYKSLNNFAIPITLVICAVISITCAYSGLNIYGGIDKVTGQYYNGLINFADMSVWLPKNIEDVIFFGYLGKNAPTKDFGSLLVEVLKNPSSYIAMFSLIFVNLFDTTSTLIAVGKDAGITDENGNLKNANKAVLADATGALICAPLGTSTVTSFVESTAGVAYGAKTGLSAVSSSVMFLLCIFIYPLFSFFTASCVTAPALFGVGTLIFVNNMKDIDWSNKIIASTCFIGLIFTVLTYSISMGLGLAIISYTLMMVATKRGKEVSLVIYMIAFFYMLNIILSELLTHI